MKQLSPSGFDLFPIIVVNFMYKLELSVEKNILKHLLWILHCVDPSQVALLNKQYIKYTSYSQKFTDCRL
ncbi:hypothetical protein J3R82DRAFT_1294 [Butyriboletus roseoflavus]|nr:hypothetical protein J3R82DRAFT_1294 [Butyriboletus roseoflavus]